MRTMIHLSLAAVGLAAFLSPTPVSAAGSASDASAREGGPAIGDVLEYKFRTPPMNSYGLTNLSELRGRPLLIEFWGTR